MEIRSNKLHSFEFPLERRARVQAARIAELEAEIAKMRKQCSCVADQTAHGWITALTLRRDGMLSIHGAFGNDEEREFVVYLRPNDLKAIQDSLGNVRLGGDERFVLLYMSMIDVDKDGNLTLRVSA